MVHLTIAEEGKKRGNFIVSAASHTNAARQERMCVCVPHWWYSQLSIYGICGEVGRQEINNILNNTY